jgi:hypothetical protein
VDHPLRAGQRSSKHGAAAAEALIAVPLFALLFASILYFHALARAKQDVLLEARRAAWQAALAGCSSDAANGVKTSPGSALPRAEELDARTTQDEKDDAARYDRVASMTIVGPAISALAPRGLVAKRKADVSVSSPLPDAPQRVSAKAYLSCNEQAHEPGDVALDLAKGLLDLPW